MGPIQRPDQSEGVDGGRFVKQWEVWSLDLGFGPHPAVVISPPAMAENKEVRYLNVLQCGSQRASRPARAHEVILDVADGLDWETLVRCDRIHLADRECFRRRIGEVSRERRQALGRKIIQVFGLLG